MTVRAICAILENEDRCAVAEPQSAPIAFARQLITTRRKREQMFGKDVFGEPAWDMMLELYVAAHSDEMLSISSLCAVSAVPATTALRFIGTMMARGFFEKRKDHADGRRFFVILSRDALARMHHLLSGMCGDADAASAPTRWTGALRALR